MKKLSLAIFFTACLLAGACIQPADDSVDDPVAEAYDYAETYQAYETKDACSNCIASCSDRYLPSDPNGFWDCAFDCARIPICD